MPEWEVVGSMGLTVRVLAASREEAIDTALLVHPDLGDIRDAGTVLPVGWDGGDAEDALAEGESLDVGDYK